MTGLIKTMIPLLYTNVFMTSLTSENNSLPGINLREEMFTVAHDLGDQSNFNGRAVAWGWLVHSGM